jgi:hypothetical protein
MSPQPRSCLQASCKEEPFVKGPCYAIIERWSFNPKTKQCESFEYGGCEGTRNNYHTALTCEKRCGVKTDVCQEEPFVKGACKARSRRWSYNIKTWPCESFSYGGCEGTLNNFGTKEACEKRCDVEPICKCKKVKRPVCNPKTNRSYDDVCVATKCRGEKKEALVPGRCMKDIKPYQ